MLQVVNSNNQRLLRNFGNCPDIIKRIVSKTDFKNMKQLWYIISKCDKIEIEKCEGWLCRLYIAYNYLVLNVCSVHGEKVVILHHPPSCSFPPIGFYPAMCNVHVIACVTIFENDLSLQTAFYTLHIHPWKKYIGREYTQTEQNHLDWRRRWYYRYFNCLCMEQFIKVSLIII